MTAHIHNDIIWKISSKDNLMYTCIKLNLYSEGSQPLSHNIKQVLIDSGIPFKELRNSTLLFSAIKNPENIIIAKVSSATLLSQIESFAKNCYNYQNRIFIVFEDKLLSDNFFTNSCDISNLSHLAKFLNTYRAPIPNKPSQPANLLIKLVRFELKKLQIPTKYIGFNYLTQLAVNYLCNNYSSNTYIELFEYVAGLNLASIDTIERDVRHMILTTWKNNAHFRNALQCKNVLEKPNSKNILTAILSYLKDTI